MKVRALPVPLCLVRLLARILGFQPGEERSILSRGTMRKRDRDKQRAYQRDHYQRNKAEIIRKRDEWREILRDRIIQYKLEKGCMDCGYKDHYAALEFDHVRGTKEYNISEMPSKGCGWEKIQREIDKCEIVCANCHRVRTFDRM